MHEKTAAQVRFEIGQIDKLFVSYAKLFENAQETEPNLVEITALASVLHFFYTGLEKIFESIAKGIDGGVPTGTSSHRDLLHQMADATQNREAVLPSDLVQSLIEYLLFRHFYRHSYSYFLEWNEMEKLVIPLPDLWAQTKSEIERFLAHLAARSHS